MTIEQLVSCAPFRLQTLRPYTNYEWSVVFNAIHEGIAATLGSYSNTTRFDANALFKAIIEQQSCPTWKGSFFGPGPSVPRNQYFCLGSWFATLNTESKAQVIDDILKAALLCNPNAPWLSCPGAGKYQTVASMWEGSQQQGDPRAMTNVCDQVRSRTAYVPLTGDDLVKLLGKLSNAQIPAAFIPTLSNIKSFLVGIQIHPQIQLSDLMGSIEEIGIVWEPGKGISVKNMVLSGQIDISQILALLGNLLPNIINDWFGNLPNAFEQILPQLPQINVDQIINDMGNLLGGALPLDLFRQNWNSQLGPSIPKTGLDVTDKPVGSTEPAKPDTRIEDEIKKTYEQTDTTTLAAIALGITALIWFAFKKR